MCSEKERAELSRVNNLPNIPPYLKSFWASGLMILDLSLNTIKPVNRLFSFPFITLAPLGKTSSFGPEKSFPPIDHYSASLPPALPNSSDRRWLQRRNPCQSPSGATEPLPPER